MGGIEALVSSLGANGTSTRRRASWALIDIGDPAVPYLLSALKEISSYARKRAAMVLGWIGSKKAVIPLTWALADNNLEVRRTAAWALGKIGEAKAVTALEHSIDDLNSRDEKINNEIAVLNERLQIFEYQITDLEYEMMQSEISENRELCYKKPKEIWDFWHIILYITRREITVTEKDKIDTSIKVLKKSLQVNKDIEEYAREAIQRLNYN